MIKNIFKKSFEWSKEKKDLFVLLFFTQALYLGVFAYVFVTGFYQIMEHANFLLEGISSITPEQIASNTINSPLALYSHYNSLIGAVFLLIILGYLCYLVLNGINWSISDIMVNEKPHFFRGEGLLTLFGGVALLFVGRLIYSIEAEKSNQLLYLIIWILVVVVFMYFMALKYESVKRFFAYFPKYIVFTLFFTVPLMIAGYFFLRLITITGLQAMFLTIFGIITLVFWYFMTISFGLIERYSLKKFSRHLKKTFEVGFKKAGILVPVGLIVLVILAMLLMLVSVSTDIFILMVISIILLMLAVVYTRILWMTAVREASEGMIKKKSKR